MSIEIGIMKLVDSIDRLNATLEKSLTAQPAKQEIAAAPAAEKSTKKEKAEKKTAAEPKQEAKAPPADPLDDEEEAAAEAVSYKPEDLRDALTALQTHYSAVAKTPAEKDSAKDKVRETMEKFGGSRQISKIPPEKFGAVIGEAKRILETAGK